MKLIIKNKTYEVIEHDKKLIRKIVHLSNIHIRKTERADEYKYVFSQLFQKLASLNLTNENTVIAVTGDIIHDKEQLTGNSVDLLKDLFLGL